MIIKWLKILKNLKQTISIYKEYSDTYNLRNVVNKKNSSISIFWLSFPFLPHFFTFKKGKIKKFYINATKEKVALFIKLLLALKY